MKIRQHFFQALTWPYPQLYLPTSCSSHVLYLFASLVWNRNPHQSAVLRHYSSWNYRIRCFENVISNIAFDCKFKTRSPIPTYILLAKRCFILLQPFASERTRFIYNENAILTIGELGVDHRLYCNNIGVARRTEREVIYNNICPCVLVSKACFACLWISIQNLRNSGRVFIYCC